MQTDEILPFPVYDEGNLPFLPRETLGTPETLHQFREAVREEITRGELTLLQYCVLDVLVSHADTRTGHCFLGRRDIADKLRATTVTISRATTRLQKLGIIAKFGRGGLSSSCDYVILFSAEAFVLAKLFHDGSLRKHRERVLSIPLEELHAKVEAYLSQGPSARAGGG